MSRFGAGEVITVPVLVQRVAARGQVTEVRTRVLVVATDRAWTDLIPGQELRVPGRFAPARPRSADGRAAAGPWSAAAGLDGAVAGPGAVDVRAGLRSAVAGPRVRTSAAWCPAWCSGDTSGMDPELEADFRVAGLSSRGRGLRFQPCPAAGRRAGPGATCGVRVRALPVVGLATVVVFVFIARPEPSLSAGGGDGDRRAWSGSPPDAAGGRHRRCARAVVVLLLVDPWLARSYGFALSVVRDGRADRARAALARPPRLPGCRGPGRRALAVPAAAQAACGPVIVLLTDEVGLIAIPANLLAVPAVAAGDACSGCWPR